MARFGTASAGGRRWSPPADADREKDPDVDPDSFAHSICLHLLTSRARTRAELADALKARDVPDDAASRVLDRLSRVRLIDDKAFAASFVQSRHHDRGLSARELARQLRAKGVEESLVDEAVAELGPDREQDTARQLVERKLRSMARLEPQVQTRRLVGMLARKGYSPGMAFQLVRDVIGAQASELEDGDTAWLA